YRGVTLEDEVFVGPHATFTNDIYQRSFNVEWEVIPTIVRRGASIGANATIICGVTIGEYAMVGAGAVVTKDVPPHGLVLGNPARLVGFVCFCGKPLKEKDKVKEESKVVVYKCERCGKEVEIPLELYKQVMKT
ncbi:MAG: acyltransferase, partial [Zestosphaera sp.]